MKLKAILLLITAIGSMLLLPAGCKDPYGASLKAAADIGTSIAQGMKTIDALRQQGLISVAEESNVLGYLEFANKADEAYQTCVDTAHTSSSTAGTFTSCATTFNTSLNNPTELALINVSNTTASQDISTIVSGITTAVSSLIIGLGGA